MAWNVRDFGAVGNGTTPDDEAFKRAIAVACETGGTLNIPAGRYRLTRQIEGPEQGVMPEGSGLTPVVSSTPYDRNFYEVEVQRYSRGAGTCRWRLHPNRDWVEVERPFQLGVRFALGDTPASFTIPTELIPGVPVVDDHIPQGYRFKWRGAGSKSLPWKSLTLQGDGRENTILEFDFSATEGQGDGLVAFWNTRAQVAIGVRIADLFFRNTSNRNKCGTSTPVPVNEPPPGFIVTGSPTGALDRYRVEILGGGGRGVATYRFTRNWGLEFQGGTVGWSLPDLVPASGVCELPGAGLTVTFPAAPMTSGQAWNFEPTGYGGSAILNVGGCHIEIERVYTQGWKVGFTNDAGIEVHCRDCVFTPGVLDAANSQTIGTMIGNANLYFRVSVCSNIISYTGGSIAGRFGVLDFGGVVHRFEDINFSGSGTALYFGAGCAYSTASCYFEGTTVALFETDYYGSIDGFVIRDWYMANTFKVPFLINRLGLINAAIRNIHCTGSPDGSAPTPYGTPAAQNTALIRAGGSQLQQLEIDATFILTSPGTLSTHDPFLGGRIHGPPRQFSRHGLNTLAPQATLHVHSIDPEIPAARFERTQTGARFEVGADAQEFTLASGLGATGGGPRGLVSRTIRATTSQTGGRVVAYSRAIPTRQMAVVTVTALAFINANSATGAFRHRAFFHNFAGGANAVQVGATVKEWQMLSESSNLTEPAVSVNAAATGFHIVVESTNQLNFVRWELIIEICQGGDGG